MTTTFRDQEELRRAAAAAPFGSEVADVLRVLDEHLHSARRLLDMAPEASVHAVERLLVEADDLFATLVRNPDTDNQAAQHIENIRDRLSGHLVAAVAMDSADVPSAAILRRGVQGALSEITAIWVGG